MAEISLGEATKKYTIPHKTLLQAIRDNRETWSAHQVPSNRLWLFDDESRGFKEWLAQYTPGRGAYRKKHGTPHVYRPVLMEKSLDARLEAEAQTQGTSWNTLVCSLLKVGLDQFTTSFPDSSRLVSKKLDKMS